jgi:hypothetical protein
VAGNPGTVQGAPECRSRGAEQAVHFADRSLHDVSKWVEPTQTADDAIDQLVCH